MTKQGEALDQPQHAETGRDGDPSHFGTGVYAALLTPRDAHGALDESSLRRNVTFLWERGIRGFALNGATGEYCLTGALELRTILKGAIQAAGRGGKFLCGIGGAGVQQCLDRGEAALDAGATGLLLPMPHFFPYQQDDLELFCREISSRFTAPILLYNLPQFTGNPLQPEMVRTLISECPNIVGIKDSSGSLLILRDLTLAGIPARRFVGNDNVLPQALQEGICDGVISGVAGVFPELIQRVYQAAVRSDAAELSEGTRNLGEFLRHIEPFPVPWALRIIAQVRGILPGAGLPPLSPRRIAQQTSLQEWYAARAEGAVLHPNTPKAGVLGSPLNPERNPV